MPIPKQVTLFNLTTIDHAAHAHAMKRCVKYMPDSKRVLFTDDLTDRPGLFENRFDIVKIPKFADAEGITAYEAVSIFALCDMPAMILPRMDSHILSIQWDGFIINPDAWTDEFLEYDYIGAPMFNSQVGNMGFCLQSRKYFEALTKMQIDRTPAACHPNDHVVSIHRKAELEQHGVKFAPVELAGKFSRENDPPYGKDVFGGHGKLFVADIVRQGRYI